MSFMDVLKRSLGFDEKPTETKVSEQKQSYKQSYPNDNFMYPSSGFEVETIFPDQSFYEIILIKPKSGDDVDYVVDQVVEESNPVIVDLDFLSRSNPEGFRIAGQKINHIRENYGAEAFLLAKTEDKELIIIVPSKVKLMKKD